MASLGAFTDAAAANDSWFLRYIWRQSRAIIDAVLVVEGVPGGLRHMELAAFAEEFWFSRYIRRPAWAVIVEAAQYPRGPVHMEALASLADADAWVQRYMRRRPGVTESGVTPGVVTNDAWLPRYRRRRRR